MYSSEKDSASRKLLRDLEVLRAVFIDTLKLKPKLRLDVTIYYFRSRKDFLAYAPGSLRKGDALAGFYKFFPDRAVICIAPAEDEEAARQVIFHEYVHHLFRMVEYDPPLWFNEGTANIFAGMEVGRDHVVIGTPLFDSALFLRQERLIPLGELFAATHESKVYTEERHAGVFYAESWAFLHYLKFGSNNYPAGALDKFIAVAGNRETAARADLRAHFRDAFGCDYADMMSRLRDYIRVGRFRMSKVPLPEIPSAASYKMRQPARAEVALRLAELALKVDRSPNGRLLLMNAAFGERVDLRALETLGADAYVAGEWSRAADYWERAVAAGSANVAVVRELALMEGRLWFDVFDGDFRLNAEAAARLRLRLLSSIEREPEQRSAYEMLAWVEAFAAEPEAANVNRVTAHLPEMSEKVRTLVGLAMVMFRVGRTDDAALFVAHLRKLQLSDFDARAVDYLESALREIAPEKFHDDATPQQLVAPPETPGFKTPSVPLPDDL